MSVGANTQFKNVIPETDEGGIQESCTIIEDSGISSLRFENRNDD
ncbi:hypothetical protein [Ekhidna sp.]